MKLTKTEQTKLNEFVDKLRELDGEYDDLRTQMEDKFAQIKQLIGEAEEFRSGIASRAREAYDEKSENWQGSDAGQELDDFANQWENEEFEKPDEDEFGQPTNASGIADTLENLPIES